MSETESPLNGKTVLVTGAARRIGRALALACARAGADIVIHHNQSKEEAKELQAEITKLGRTAWTIAADLSKPDEISKLIRGAHEIGPLFGLVNSAAIFESLSLNETTLEDWERHMAVNLTAPFLLSQAFAKQVRSGESGRIVNILDWRGLLPEAKHFPYSIAKAALAAMTKSLALALAPNITVNGLALGAILPPADEPINPEILKNVPSARWAEMSEVQQALIFLLAGPAYITGEIIHVDGGRHLV